MAAAMLMEHEMWFGWGMMRQQIMGKNWCSIIATWGFEQRSLVSSGENQDPKISPKNPQNPGKWMNI